MHFRPTGVARFQEQSRVNDFVHTNILSKSSGQSQATYQECEKRERGFMEWRQLKKKQNDVFFPRKKGISSRSSLCAKRTLIFSAEYSESCRGARKHPLLAGLLYHMLETSVIEMRFQIHHPLAFVR